MTTMAAAKRNGFILTLAKILVVAVIINFTSGQINSDNQHEFNLVDSDSQTLPLILVADYDKRNNVNKFKNLMINKDNPNSFLEEDGQRDEQIYYYNPRVASGNGGGKKRGAILSSLWAVAAPGNNRRFGNSNYRQVNTLGLTSRPAAK